MTTAYKAVRAHALDGEAVAPVPSGGVGIIMRSGVPTWLATWATSPPPVAPAMSWPTDLPSVVSALRSDLVMVLASMALSHGPAVQP